MVLCVCTVNSNQIASGGGDGFIRLWDVVSAMCVSKIQAHQGDVWQIVSIRKKDQCKKIASCSADKTIKVFNIETLNCELMLVGHLEPVRCLIYLPDVDYLGSGSFDYRIKVWNL